MTLFIEDIKKIIPHRYPFLMIDRVEDVQVGQSCTAYKNVSANEWFFEGHFPEHPIMPGVLVIEAMAQAAGVLAFYTLIDEKISNESSKFVYFTSIENVKFKKTIVPGDVVKFDVNITQRRGNKYWRFSGTASVNDTITDTADFMAMIPNG